jgi:hypothetical protein
VNRERPSVQRSGERLDVCRPVLELGRPPADSAGRACRTEPDGHRVEDSGWQCQEALEARTRAGEKSRGPRVGEGGRGQDRGLTPQGRVCLRPENGKIGELGEDRRVP